MDDNDNVNLGISQLTSALMDPDESDVILSSAAETRPMFTAVPLDTRTKSSPRMRSQTVDLSLSGLDEFGGDNSGMAGSNLVQPEGIPSVSLMIGEGENVAHLHSNIMRVTIDHQVKVVKPTRSFEQCNEHTYQMIWVLVNEPVEKEQLNLTTFIRYMSKHNRNTTVIMAADKPLSADLRVHGVDDTVLLPVKPSQVRALYSNWTLVPTNNDGLESEDDDQHSLQTLSNPATPATPATPSTPNTPASVSDDADRSGFSISMDSGIESPPTFQLPMTNTPAPQFTHVRSLNPSSRANLFMQSCKAADHTTKEKVRRERIKESCDQLRVLLPYIRGRKTDMASTLEMCVDYLQIVNTFMPQALQDHIVEILSKDSPPEAGTKLMKSSNKKVKDEKLLESPSVTSTVHSAHSSPVSHCGTPIKKPTVISLTQSDLSDMGKRGNDIHAYIEKPSKRLRLQMGGDGVLSQNVDNNNNNLQPNSHTTQLDTKHLEQNTPVSRLDDISAQMFSFHPNCGHVPGKPFPELETYPTHLYTNTSDQYAYGTYGNPKVQSQIVDADVYRPTYMDGHFYPVYNSLLSTPTTQSRLFPQDFSSNATASVSTAPYNMSLKQEETQSDELQTIAIDSVESDEITLTVNSP